MNIFLVIVFIIMGIIFIFKDSFNTDIQNGTCAPIKIDKCFVINLPESTERLASFKNSYKLDIPLEIIPGINTKIEEASEKYKHLVDPEKYDLMYKFDKGIEIRPNHTYFNSGALGCYLGHMAFYETCFNQNLNYAIIFEDNVVLKDSFNEDLEKALTNLGDDFDACFFHCWNNVSSNIIKCNSSIKKLKFITSTKCYLINVKRMKKYYNLFYPINNHVDMIYEKLIYNGADIYLINLNSVLVPIMNSKSIIAHTSIKNNKHFQYLEDAEEKNVKHCRNRFIDLFN